MMRSIDREKRDNSRPGFVSRMKCPLTFYKIDADISCGVWEGKIML